MKEIEKLLAYFQEEIFKFENIYNQRRNEINLLKENLLFFDTDIEKIDLDLIKKLFDEVYLPEIATLNLIVFKDIIKLKDYLNLYQDELQIQTCLKYLEEFKGLFLNKINVLEINLSDTDLDIDNKINLYKTFLTYFEDNNLVRPLTSKELEILLENIVNSNLDLELISNIITNITISNIDLYQKQGLIKNNEKILAIRKNSSRISKLIEETVEENKETEEIEKIEEIELTQEKQELYNQVLEIYSILKKEKFNIGLDALELIKKDDFTLDNLRKDLYSQNINLGNRWAIIYYDLEVNLLNNFKEHKEEISIVFKYIIELFKTNFLSTEEWFNNIVKFNQDEISLIQEFIIDYDELSENDINLLDSMNELILVSGQDAIKGYKYTYEEYLYYFKIGELKKLYTSYEEKIEEDVENEKELFSVLSFEINSLINDIKNLLLEIKKCQEVLENLEEQEDNLIENYELPYVNLLIFLPFENKTIPETLESEIDAIKKNYQENADEFISQNLNSLEKWILPFEFKDIKKVSKMGKKSKNGKLEDNGNKPKFAKYDVFRYKRKIGKSSRLSYMIISINEKNKEILKKEFNLENLDQLCLVLNLDASLGKEKDYVKRTYDILVSEEDKIKYIKDIFENEFTKESFEIAKSLIKTSMDIYDTLKKKYLENDVKIIGDDHNE